MKTILVRRATKVVAAVAMAVIAAVSVAVSVSGPGPVAADYLAEFDTSPG